MDRFILFTKHFKELQIPALIDASHTIGVQGIDMAVRPEYPVHAGNVRTALPAAARDLRKANLTLPLVSTPVEFVDPDSKFADDLYSACHDAGIENVKIGYFEFNDKPYYEQLANARKQIDKFAKLGSRFGVRTLLHTHSGKHLGLNVSGMMDLTRDLNPFEVGIYVDPGHLAINGEPLDMGIRMPGDKLSMVGLKDFKRRSAPPYIADWVPMGEGVVDWKLVANTLKSVKYRGWMSIFCEWNASDTKDAIRLAKQDTDYFRKISGG
ncbi:MAG: sugar phosphate isomerase/epimerase family protein [Chthonomonadales bacterium]